MTQILYYRCQLACFIRTLLWKNISQLGRGRRWPSCGPSAYIPPALVCSSPLWDSSFRVFSQQKAAQSYWGATPFQSWAEKESKNTLHTIMPFVPQPYIIFSFLPLNQSSLWHHWAPLEIIVVIMTYPLNRTSTPI